MSPIQFPFFFPLGNAGRFYVLGKGRNGHNSPNGSPAPLFIEVEGFFPLENVSSKASLPCSLILMHNVPHQFLFAYTQHYYFSPSFPYGLFNKNCSPHCGKTQFMGQKVDFFAPKVFNKTYIPHCGKN